MGRRRWQERHPIGVDGEARAFYTEHRPPWPGMIRLKDALDLPDDEERHYVATHEAAHAVAAAIGGATGTRAWIGPHPDPGAPMLMGAVNFDDWTAPWDRYGAMLAAGEVAAFRWLDEHDRATPQRRWATEAASVGDRLRAAEAAREHHGMALTFGDPSGPEGFDWVDLVAGAEEVLGLRWSTVQRVAEALHERGELGTADLDGLL